MILITAIGLMLKLKVKLEDYIGVLTAIALVPFFLGPWIMLTLQSVLNRNAHDDAGKKIDDYFIFKFHAAVLFLISLFALEQILGSGWTKAFQVISLLGIIPGLLSIIKKCTSNPKVHGLLSKIINFFQIPILRGLNQGAEMAGSTAFFIYTLINWRNGSHDENLTHLKAILGGTMAGSAALAFVVEFNRPPLETTTASSAMNVCCFSGKTLYSVVTMVMLWYLWAEPSFLNTPETFKAANPTLIPIVAIVFVIQVVCKLFTILKPRNFNLSELEAATWSYLCTNVFSCFTERYSSSCANKMISFLRYLVRMLIGLLWWAPRTIFGIGIQTKDGAGDEDQTDGAFRYIELGTTIIESS